MPSSRAVMVAAAGVVVAATIVGLAYLLGAATADPAATAPAERDPRPPVADTGPARAQAPADEPVVIAIAWLRAYRGIRWTDPEPGAWIDRARPFIGADLAAEYDTYRGGGGGAQWSRFVTDECTATVRDAGGVIPPEAPRTADAVYVQVSGTVVTDCTTGEAPVPREPVAATVEVRQIDDDRWVVRQRLF